MKIAILDKQGKKKSEIETQLFQKTIRKDIIQKVLEAEKIKQPYAPSLIGGKQASAAGKIRHQRRKWKSAAGRGISRIPRKTFWRRGTQFYWQGATVSSARGGRRAHPPKILSMLKQKKINKKEKEKAFLSALAIIADIDEVKGKYKRLEDKDIKIKLPIVVEDKILDVKTKDFLVVLKKILDNLHVVAIQKKTIRAGRGKTRGRKYKRTAGLLFVVGKKEDKNINGIDIIKSNELIISDLVAGGARLVMFTESAIKELESRLIKKEKEKEVKKEENKKDEEKKK